MERKFLSEIKGFEDFDGYSVTKDGKIWSHIVRHDKKWIMQDNPKRELISEPDKKGYRRIRLSHDNVKKSARVHRIVALAFIPNPENKPQVNHIDGNKENNSVENLEWVTNTENHKHKMEHGLNVSVKGDLHYTHRYKAGEHHGCKKVLQLDLNGNVIAEYASLQIAAKAVNLHYSNISKVLHGVHEFAGGYRWKFKDEGSTTIESA